MTSFLFLLSLPLTPPQLQPPHLYQRQLRKYDCYAESTALAHARTCSGKLSNPDTRPGLKENFIEIYKTYMNLPQTARHMAWHNNVRLGCGIARCPSFYFVVCHYAPGGNYIGQPFYTVGSPCSMCPGGTTCNNSTVLCDSP
ncbi:hypothetical protein ANCDUO_23029 [Ancylostoma duodenale]|uniref:SCP domain-containing protein n=1 Tax=Ancylostoma duodenale TaxID=51022 RepID=A0A0C2FJJ9_9BILA|nr:hypothetical protein ANCDUO_23029 [Ancylostoma duodenale]